MGNIENLESVKSIAETNFKICFVIIAKNVRDKEYLQIIYKSVQFVSKLKNQHNDFPYFP